MVMVFCRPGLKGECLLRSDHEPFNAFSDRDVHPSRKVGEELAGAAAGPLDLQLANMLDAVA